jgi:hypothetical protein
LGLLERLLQIDLLLASDEILSITRNNPRLEICVPEKKILTDIEIICGILDALKDKVVNSSTIKGIELVHRIPAKRIGIDGCFPVISSPQGEAGTLLKDKIVLELQNNSDYGIKECLWKWMFLAMGENAYWEIAFIDVLAKDTVIHYQKMLSTLYKDTTPDSINADWIRAAFDGFVLFNTSGIKLNSVQIFNEFGFIFLSFSDPISLEFLSRVSGAAYPPGGLDWPRALGINFTYTAIP